MGSSNKTTLLAVGLIVLIILMLADTFLSAIVPINENKINAIMYTRMKDTMKTGALLHNNSVTEYLANVDCLSEGYIFSANDDMVGCMQRDLLVGDKCTMGPLCVGPDPAIFPYAGCGRCPNYQERGEWRRASTDAFACDVVWKGLIAGLTVKGVTCVPSTAFGDGAFPVCVCS